MCKLLEMSSDDDFEDTWFDSAEVDAIASAVEAGKMGSAGPALKVEIENDKKRERSSSMDIIEKPRTYRTPHQRFRKRAGFLSATDVSELLSKRHQLIASCHRYPTSNGALIRNCTRRLQVGAGYGSLSRSSR